MIWLYEQWMADHRRRKELVTEDDENASEHPDYDQLLQRIMEEMKQVSIFSVVLKGLNSMN
jgi:transcription initiation factor IIE alpha subunit